MYDIYGGLGSNRRPVIRDDGKVYDSVQSANMAMYGYVGDSISRAIRSGRKAKGHYWKFYEEKGAKRSSNPSMLALLFVVITILMSIFEPSYAFA